MSLCHLGAALVILALGGLQIEILISKQHNFSWAQAGGSSSPPSSAPGRRWIIKTLLALVSAQGLVHTPPRAFRGWEGHLRDISEPLSTLSSENTAVTLLITTTTAVGALSPWSSSASQGVLFTSILKHSQIKEFNSKGLTATCGTCAPHECTSALLLQEGYEHTELAEAEYKFSLLTT